MISMSVTELAAATGAAVLLDPGEGLAGDVVIDSRRVGAGDVFVAFAGERSDGNAYLAQAARAGAGRAPARGRPEPPRAAAGHQSCCTQSAGAWRPGGPRSRRRPGASDRGHKSTSVSGADTDPDSGPRKRLDLRLTVLVD